MDQNNEPTTPEGTPAETPETTAGSNAVVASNATEPSPQTSNAVARSEQAPAQDIVVAPATTTPAPVAAQPVYEAHTLQKNFEHAPATDASAAAAAAPDASGAPTKPAKPARTASETFRRRSVGILIGGVAACAVALGGGGFALGATLAATNATTSSTVTSLPQTVPGTTDGSTDSGSTDSGISGNSGSTGGSGTTTLPQQTTPFGGSDSSASTSTDATPATDEETEGVVTIISNLYYSDSSEAAGTGIILSSDGKILTNNHVIEGATSIEVTVESTGKTYVANVVGTDATNDVALLQLVGASGLKVSTTETDTPAVGDEVASIGNAEGTGDLVTAAGTITALEQSITVGNEYSGAEESLENLIQIDADVVSGDSGGPLVNADGDVIGIVTAASSGSADITGFAIPISDALDIIDQIESGVETDTVEIGLPAFLGIQLSTATTTQTTAGVAVGGVIAGTPAEEAGLVAGDTITAVDGTAVATSDALSDLIGSYEPGDSVTVTYTNAAGTSQTVTVTLSEGPAA